MRVGFKIIIGVLVLINLIILIAGISSEVCFNKAAWATANMITTLVCGLALVCIGYPSRINRYNRCHIISLILLISIFDILNISYCGGVLLNPMVGCEFKSNIIAMMLPVGILLTHLITLLLIILSDGI